MPLHTDHHVLEPITTIRRLLSLQVSTNVLKGLLDTAIRASSAKNDSEEFLGEREKHLHIAKQHASEPRFTST